MLKITSFTIENAPDICVTDEKKPHFRWTCESDQNGVSVEDAILSVNGWNCEVQNNLVTTYEGPELKPFSNYDAYLNVTADNGDSACKKLTFRTGFLKTGFSGSFITDGDYVFKEKKVSPKVMTFRKKVELNKKVISAYLYATAIGVYRIVINGEKVSDEFLTPGFTSYKKNLQYQTIDVKDLLSDNNEIIVNVAGGWAVGSFVYSRENRVIDNKQSFWCELHIMFEDGRIEKIVTDESWEVSLDGPFKMADLYDGEDYDARVSYGDISFKKAKIADVKVKPEIMAAYGAPLIEHETFIPKLLSEDENGLIYDFGQNFAGLIHLEIDGQKDQVITVRHAEILRPDGSLNTDFLRSARAGIVYTCKEGKQEYIPTFTYMGFRYVSVGGIDKDKIKVTARALYSDVKDTGSFSCSNNLINRLQENIRWGAKSNFVDIPTDCPQRDERMGWTGDIALFSGTACFNFDMSRFFTKWLKDMRAEQIITGGIPNTVPSNGFGFPVTMPTMAIDFWGDASVLVPYAEYMARGDVNVLKDNYNMMKKYVDACLFWAKLFSFGKKRYIWNTLYTLHFGDWVAPDVPTMDKWQKRSKWTATASLCNTSRHLSKIAAILGEKADELKYKEIADRTADAYEEILTDGNGRLYEEFQTAYVLPLYFGMFSEKNRQKAADNLAALVKKNNYKIGTGFPGTPYILFALADNGHANEAYEMLLNTSCPSWLYEVKQGATTIWERWDALDEDGNCPIGDDGTDTMISYNHYASGAVGDFLYRRIAGIEAVESGYKKFRIKPLPGGEITNAKAKFLSPYGEIESDWKMDGGSFVIKVKVPMGCSCELILPDGTEHNLSSGRYEFTCEVG